MFENKTLLYEYIFREKKNSCNNKSEDIGHFRFTRTVNIYIYIYCIVVPIYTYVI